MNDVLISNWMEKLKPSSKNRVMNKKLHKLFTGNEDTEELSKILGVDPLTQNQRVETNPHNQSVLTQKWDNYVKMSKKSVELDFNNQSLVLKEREADNISIISENFEEINSIIGNICF